MTYLLDTSILVRLANSSDRFYQSTLQAVIALHRHQAVLQITPQTLIEFRSVATRPIEVNGLGLSSKAATAQANQFEDLFSLLTDNALIFPLWKDLVDTVGVIGKQVHDARIVAVCLAHNISHLLTFNIQHFERLATYGNGVMVISPDTMEKTFLD